MMATSITTMSTEIITTTITSTQPRSEEHTSELQSQSNLVCRLLLEKKKQRQNKVSDRVCKSYATLSRTAARFCVAWYAFCQTHKSTPESLSIFHVHS